MSIINDISNFNNINNQTYFFRDVVETLTNHKILQFTGTQTNQILKDLEQIGNQTIKNIGQFNGRANEYGNFVEQEFKNFCNLSNKLQNTTPINTNGVAQSAGYPDGLITWNNKSFYIEVKTYKSDTLNSNLRTFFYSPSKISKITQDTYHLLIGFETDGNNHLKGFHIIDLYDLEVTLKTEFNTGNNGMYNNCLY